MSDLAARFRLGFGLEHEEPAAGIFIARILDAGLRELRSGSWATSGRSLDGVAAPLFRSEGSGSDSVLADLEGALVLVTLQSGYAHAQAAAQDGDVAAKAINALRDLLPAPEPVARHDVPVAFWTYSPNGPIPSLRPIAVPEWDEIRDNYAAATQSQLDAIMRDFRPAHGGQLVLWHGEAGTGKTFALRALAWEWRDWCQLHYIVDPDTFFGERADYLMSVLTQPEGMTMGLHAVSAFHGGIGSRVVLHGFGDASWNEPELDDEVDQDVDHEDGGLRSAKHWRLLVLEDTGELLTPDAKSIIGQGLSRFLNVVDGLIGQGLRVLVLVTTNEEIRALHPAVARPGRCAANIEFHPLSSEEAASWLVAHGVVGAPPQARILASLYAQAEGFDPTQPRPSIGFGDAG